MIYLSGVETPGLRQLRADRYPVGVLDAPANKWSLERLDGYADRAFDNGCYTLGDRFDLDAFLRWLDTRPREGCRFVTAPDVVGDAAATWARSVPVLPTIRSMGFPAALVAQDGFDVAAIDWSAFDCLFVGGTTAYKLSEAAYAAVAEAKRRGKWCHMGRANSLRRLRAARGGGYDSADGTFLAFAPEQNAPRLRQFLDRLRAQPALV